MATTIYDVAVIGAGPAGSAVARRLALAGLRVTLIERTRFDDQRYGESLAPSVQPLLAELGVLRDFVALSPIPSLGVRSFWGPAPQEHSHLFNPYGSGWHIDRLAFDCMLAQSAVAAGAELRVGTRVTGCRATGSGHWLLTTVQRKNTASERQSEKVCARLCIDASGRRAHLARLMGARPIVFDRLVGVASLFAGVDTTAEGHILLETRPEGWWYSAPAGHGKMMVMLMTDSDLCGRGKYWSPPCFADLMARAQETSRRITGPVEMEPRVVSAISHRLGRRERNCAWLAIGDAALSVDPISGSGVVRALRNADAGAATALAVLKNGTNRAIKAYEANCDSDCTVFLRERAFYYGLETRWSNHPFWQRRLAALDRLAASS